MTLGFITSAFTLIFTPFPVNKIKYSQYALPVKKVVTRRESRQETDGCYSNSRLCFVDIPMFEPDLIPKGGEAFSKAAGNRNRAMPPAGTPDTDGQITTSLSLE